MESIGFGKTKKEGLFGKVVGFFNILCEGNKNIVLECVRWVNDEFFDFGEVLNVFLSEVSVFLVSVFCLEIKGKVCYCLGI